MNTFLLLLQAMILAAVDSNNVLNRNIIDVFSPPPSIDLRLGEEQDDTLSSNSCYLESGGTGECAEWETCAIQQNDTRHNGAAFKRKQTSICGIDNECCVPAQFNLEESLGDRCGVRNPSSFVKNNESSTVAAFTEFPWMVAILRKTLVNDAQYFAYVCAGSIIHPRVVLTVAYFYGKRMDEIDVKTLWVRAGDSDLRGKFEYPPYQDRGIDNIILHENGDLSTLVNNVALLILTDPFIQAGNVQMVCLPSLNDIAADETDCIASTWNSLGPKRWILRKVKQKIVGREACKERLQRSLSKKNFILEDSLMCAGGSSGINDCQVDDGSPLVCSVYSNPKRYIQHGIAAKSINCNGTVPRLYTALGTLRQWIDLQLRTFNIDSMAYSYT